MLIMIIMMLLVTTWLAYEIKLTGRMESYGYQLANNKSPKYARYKVYNRLSKRMTLWGDTTLYEGGNLPEGYSPNGEPCYEVILTPGIDSVLCGWDWLNEHCAAMVDYQPRVQMDIGNVRYDMTIKQPSIIKDVMRVNKLTKKQKLAYA